MKKSLYGAIALALISTSSFGDMYKHNLQVFTANTMEIPCKTAPKVLFFGEAEKGEEFTKNEVKSIIDGGISSAGSNIGNWLTAQGISGKDLAAGFGAGFIGSLLGTWTRNAIYAAMDDPEYVMISECNSGKDYTRLITMVVSQDKLKKEHARDLALKDQAKMAKVAYK
jgi:hypothetical protein